MFLASQLHSGYPIYDTCFFQNSIHLILADSSVCNRSVTVFVKLYFALECPEDKACVGGHQWRTDQCDDQQYLQRGLGRCTVFNSDAVSSVVARIQQVWKKFDSNSDQ